MAATMKSTRPSSMKKMSKKRKLEDMSVDEFFMNSDSDDDSSEASFSQQPAPSKVKKTKQMTSNGDDTKGKTNSSNSSKAKKKKGSLQGLKEKDPEFYEFLLKEDKELLEEDDDEDDDMDDVDDSDGLDSDDSDDDEDEGEQRFQPPSKLEVASDEDDDDDDDDDGDSGSDGEKPKSKKKLITANMIKSWRQQAQESPSVETLRQWVGALAAAAKHAGMTVEVGTCYRVDTNAAFNAVMRLCLTGVVPLLESLLTLRSLGDQQQVFSKKNKKWKAARGTVKTYCVTMLQLSGEFSDSYMVNVVLKHIHKLVVCYAAFPKLTKVFLKKLVKLWSTGEEATRVIAFLCLNRLVRLHPDTHLDPTLKQMYMAYVNNCKFVSPTSLPMITFMQRSLVEMFLTQESLAYQHAFVYIRQLAIHLRNAITTKKKEMYQLVYNWQYILSLGLWTQLLVTAHPSPVLQPLLFPLVQVITGTVRLQPTAQYYPLRFHCVRYLTILSAAAFVPVLPFLLEVLEQTDFNRRQKGGGLKNINLSTILKFSKPQLQEKAFKESVIEELCEQLFDYLSAQSHTAAFPELIVPLVIQLKDFTKKCKVAALCRPVKQVIDKVEETAKVVEARRRATAFNLADSKAVELWESKNKEEGTPLSKFYVSWRKMQDRKKQQEMAAKDQMTTAAEKLVPEMQRAPKVPPKASAEEREEFGKLFESDDDEDGDDAFRFLPKDERQKKLDPQQLDSDEDEYSDFDSDDMEQLAQSGSEDDGSDDDNEEDDDDEDDDEDEKKKTQNGDVMKGKKQKKKQKAQAPPPPSKKARQKVHIENDRGDHVEDFSMSDSD
ncbi:nucleolar complex protein 2 homolog [Babylonia areolata]|uniref:nucleolar complex protein 2 homolog n=1 Tax=Babylonia areolata TaxID=304850 RepID=UPI003FD3662F